VDRRVEDVPAVVEEVLYPVAVVDVPVEDRDTFHPGGPEDVSAAIARLLRKQNPIASSARANGVRSTGGCSSAVSAAHRAAPTLASAASHVAVVATVSDDHRPPPVSQNSARSVRYAGWWTCSAVDRERGVGRHTPASSRPSSSTRIAASLSAESGWSGPVSWSVHAW
jgi:hypothetical protein